MKKCIVLDLDNTLWGGVVGEDGPILSLSGPGSDFVAFQQALRELHGCGVILAICSRNNFDDAMAVIRHHPCMVLTEKRFAAIRINWDTKEENIRDIALELNIDLDSMVFLDDNSYNRIAIRTFLPEVAVPEMPEDPAQYTKFLHSLPYFSADAITDEDKMRGGFYVTERLRKETEKQFPDRESFLQSLGIELHFFGNDPNAASRLSQLTERTNQFNVLKYPYTECQIKFFMGLDDDHTVFHARVIDRFGDHGIVAFALVEIISTTTWYINSFLISCRVLGYGIEDAFLSAIATHAANAHIYRLKILFGPTERNAPAREFVDRIFGPFRSVSPIAIQCPKWITVK